MWFIADVSRMTLGEAGIGLIVPPLVQIRRVGLWSLLAQPLQVRFGLFASERCGLAVPCKGFGHIFLYSEPLFVRCAKVGHPVRFTLLGGLPVPGNRLSRVLHHA